MIITNESIEISSTFPKVTIEKKTNNCKDVLNTRHLILPPFLCAQSEKSNEVNQ